MSNSVTIHEQESGPHPVPNWAGGIDLMVERSAGELIRVLTGSPKKSLEFWKTMQITANLAVGMLESDHDDFQ